MQSTVAKGGSVADGLSCRNKIDSHYGKDGADIKLRCEGKEARQGDD